MIPKLSLFYTYKLVKFLFFSFESLLKHRKLILTLEEQRRNSYDPSAIKVKSPVSCSFPDFRIGSLNRSALGDLLSPKDVFMLFSISNAIDLKGFRLPSKICSFPSEYLLSSIKRPLNLGKEKWIILLR
jgi:hypothetical protein